MSWFLIQSVYRVLQDGTLSLQDAISRKVLQLSLSPVSLQRPLWTKLSVMPAGTAELCTEPPSISTEQANRWGWS